MKKLFASMVCVLLILNLTACGKENFEEPLITRPAEAIGTEAMEAETQPTEITYVEGTEELVVFTGNYIFIVDGIELTPGMDFDPSILPEAESIYEVPSCAIEGTDNLYNYGTFELTVFDDGTREQLYSILLTDPNITTPEGLALGDNADKVLELYGENFIMQGSAYVYTGDTGMLYIIVHGNAVASIEYRMIVE